MTFTFHQNTWVRLDLNQGPRDYESPALTAELRTRHLISSPTRKRL